MIVEITTAEFDAARRDAKLMNDAARRRRASDRYGLRATPAQALRLHEHGRRAEYAAGRVLDVEVLPITADDSHQRRHAGDLILRDGRRAEVRATEYWFGGCLLVHPGDPDDRPFVLVVGGDGPYPRVFDVMGWCYGREAKRSEWWRTEYRHAAYFVPQTKLRPLVELDPAVAAHDASGYWT
jgi:hypothetical protein